MDDYTKQLEAEIEQLKKRLEVADYKAECYDVIMNGAIHEEHKPSGHIVHSMVITDKKTNCVTGISLRVIVKVANNPPAALKIINDFIEDSKALQGHNKK
jgi:hypothetical protein